MKSFIVMMKNKRISRNLFVKTKKETKKRKEKKIFQTKKKKYLVNFNKKKTKQNYPNVALF